MTRIVALLLALALGGPAAAQQGSPGPAGYLATYQAFPNTALTGTTSETNLAAVRIPANTLGAIGALRITVLFSNTNSANNKTFTLRYTGTAGSVAGGFLASTVTTTNIATQGQMFIRAAGATNAQMTYPSMSLPFGSAASAIAATSVDTTADSFVNINGTLASAGDTLTLLGYTVEVMHP